MRLFATALAVFALGACQLDGADPTPAAPAPDAPTVPVGPVSTLGTESGPSDADADAGRYTGRGRQLSGADTTGQAAAARNNPETLATIDSTRDWGTRLHLPLGGDVAGPSVAKLQVLLDRAGFSPGQIDGRWGDNTELALTWLQKAESLPATGIADRATVRALARRADAPDSLVTTVALTADDVAGPFETLPADVYEKAKLDRLGYESLAEKLGETFHAAPALLAQLNPGVTLDSLAAGDQLRVPNVRRTARPMGDVSRLVISGEAGYLHALAADGTVLFHAPVTVGASYDPSPEGEFSVRAVALDPSWHYQPSILAGVSDDAEEATLPPGPNNAVGVVWIALSKEHYGIHGTSAPGTIGYASSAGCVRLTNWDARALAQAVGAGTPVRFRDVAGRGGAARDSTRRAS
ncbi:L,D-transpeptidase family protein [Rubrivirga sp. IMCC43871]|uniref:L,D-transpeptidase family protein n=1 Tax=Rubrivirga sp. IMCC43871 TaxID=3391575 RepID=UPI0039900E23